MLYILRTVFFHNFFPVNLQYSSYKHVFPSRVENSVDPAQLASSGASLAGSTVFSKKDKIPVQQEGQVIISK